MRLQEFKDLLGSKPTAQPNEYPGTWERFTHFLKQPTQDSDSPSTCGRITGARHVGEQVLLGLAVES